MLRGRRKARMLGEAHGTDCGTTGAASANKRVRLSKLHTGPQLRVDQLRGLVTTGAAARRLWWQNMYRNFGTRWARAATTTAPCLVCYCRVRRHEGLRWCVPWRPTRPSAARHSTDYAASEPRHPLPQLSPPASCTRLELWRVLSAQAPCPLFCDHFPPLLSHDASLCLPATNCALALSLAATPCFAIPCTSPMSKGTPGNNALRHYQRCFLPPLPTCPLHTTSHTVSTLCLRRTQQPHLQNAAPAPT